MIEFFAVASDDDEAFLEAWRAEAAPGAALYRALRTDVPLRYAAVETDAVGGVLLIAPLADGWERFATHRGYLGSWVERDHNERPVAVIHWSSPLMYARAVRAEGELLAGAALYSRVGLK